MRSKLPTLGFAVILSTLIFSSCGPTTAQPTESPTGTPSEGADINLVEQAGLTSTVKIEILEFDLVSDSATRGQYVQRLAITEPEVIAQIVATLDTDLKVAPRVACIPDHELRFHLEDGTVQEFRYSCEGASFLRGDQDYWRGQDFWPPDQFDALIEGQLASADALSVSGLLENPVYDTEVRIHGEVSLLGELRCPCFELTSGGKAAHVWYGLMVEDDGTERPAVSVEGIENGDTVVVTGELKTEGAFWASNIEPLSGAEPEYCLDRETDSRLSYQEAVEIAQDSECLEQGHLKETRFCNQDTGTWWIDLDIDKPGCNPACVVNVSDRTAEINWRCTGALPPTPTAGEAALYEVTVQFNTSVTQDNLLETEGVLRTYDDGLEYVIMESFPPVGRASLATDVPDFCQTVEAELEDKSYVDGVSCRMV